MLKVSELVERLSVCPSKPLASKGISSAARLRPEYRCTLEPPELIWVEWAQNGLRDWTGLRHACCIFRAM
jgi:hypothetical protein